MNTMISLLAPSTYMSKALRHTVNTVTDIQTAGRQELSLKDFHILFIIFSILLSIAFGFWAIQYSQENFNPGYYMAGIVSFIFAFVLGVYLYKFCKKLKNS